MESGGTTEARWVSGDQEALIDALAEIGKPLVVYIQGRPLNMNNASPKADALLTA